MNRIWPKATHVYGGNKKIRRRRLPSGDQWAYFPPVAVVPGNLLPSEPLLVKLKMGQTREIGNTKVVEYSVYPAGTLLTGSPFYAHPALANLTITCQWSDFLRLTRWRKSLAHLEPQDQGLIASIQRNLTVYTLVAVDHDIRRTVDPSSTPSDDAGDAI